MHQHEQRKHKMLTEIHFRLRVDLSLSTDVIQETTWFLLIFKARCVSDEIYFPLSQAILFRGWFVRVFCSRQLRPVRSVAVERSHHVIQSTVPSEQRPKSTTTESISTATNGQLWFCISTSYEPRSLSSASTKYSIWESCISSSPVLRQFHWTANPKSLWPELFVSTGICSSSKLSSTKLGCGFPRLERSLPW